MRKVLILLTLAMMLLSLIQPAQAQVKARWIVSDKDALQARVDMIEQAQDEILVEYFYVSADDQSLGGMALLLNAARKGRKVKVILDALFASLDRSMYAALYEKARMPDGKLTLEIKLFNPLGFKLFNAFQRDHAKMLIVDGHTLMTGGRNVGDSYFGENKKRNFHDLDILVKGSLARDAKANFMAVWNSDLVKSPHLLNFSPADLDQSSCALREDFESCTTRNNFAIQEVRRQGESLERVFTDILNGKEGDLVQSQTQTDWLKNAPTIENVKFLSHKPDELPSRKNALLSHDLLKILRSAEKEANIVSPYLIPTENVMEAFQHLRDKGVRVRVITNSLRSTDNLPAQAGFRTVKNELMKMGIEIYEYKGPHTIHAKTALIDGKHILIGTYNIDPRSSFLNREMGLSLIDEKDVGLARELEAIIEKFRQDSVLVAKEGQDQNIPWQTESYNALSAADKFKLRLLMFAMPLIKHQL